MTVKTKRVYEKPTAGDGCRILVDRIWPRGLKKEDARLNGWMKGIAPSTAVRKWFGHDPARWKGFRERYFRELDVRNDLVSELRSKARRTTVTLLYASRDQQLNNAVALKEYLEKHTARG